MERKTRFFLCFFFALKARAAMLFTAETSEVLEMKNFTSAINNILLPLRADTVIPFPHLQRVSGRTDGQSTLTS